MIKFVPTRRTLSISIKPLLPSLGMDARESNTPTRVECPFLLFAEAVGFGLRHQLFSSNGPFGSDLFLYDLRTIFTHFWAGVSHVHVYACLRNAYRLTSRGQGA